MLARTSSIATSSFLRASIDCNGSMWCLPFVCALWCWVCRNIIVLVCKCAIAVTKPDEQIPRKVRWMIKPTTTTHLISETVGVNIINVAKCAQCLVVYIYTIRIYRSENALCLAFVLPPHSCNSCARRYDFARPKQGHHSFIRLLFGLMRCASDDFVHNWEQVRQFEVRNLL